MSKTHNRLTDREIRAFIKPGIYADGGNLYLSVGPTGAKSYTFRYQFNDRRREMGLGPTHAIGLADAREKARLYRMQIADGIDPITARTQRREASILSAAKVRTFKECASDYIQTHHVRWKDSGKTRQSWESSLRDHVFPDFGQTPVHTISAVMITDTLKKIWTTKTTTATRVRERIELILDAAKVAGFRSGENPAAWKGNLNSMLPNPADFQESVKHASLDFAKLPDFMSELRQQKGHGALLLEFLILTGARDYQARGAIWSEVDLDNKLWTIPAKRMKGKKNATGIVEVPLCDRAVDIIRSMSSQRRDSNEHVFPGGKSGKCLSNGAMDSCLMRMGYKEIENNITVHGFRATLATWAGEATSHDKETVKAALSHTLHTGEALGHYDRQTRLVKRVQLMNDWQRFIDGSQTSATVTSIRSAVSA